jgi:DNA polymerase sigma
MKNLLEEYPDLKVIGLILKELLKITDLNKNYTGGIGSYTLTMLAFNVLKARKVAFDGNYIHQLTTIAMYMAQDFVPYETLVSSRGNIELKANP